MLAQEQKITKGSCTIKEDIRKCITYLFMSSTACLRRSIWSSI